MKFFYNEIKEKQNHYQLACFFQNAWMSKDGWAKLAQLKKEAAQARVYRVGDKVRVSDWIFSKQNFKPDIGVSHYGIVGKITEKAVEVTVEGEHRTHTFWCPKSQIESDGVGDAKGNPQAQPLLDRYEIILKKLEENRKGRDEIEHELNKIPYDIRGLERKQKSLNEKNFKILKEFQKSEEGKKIDWRSVSAVQDARRKLEQLHPEIAQANREIDAIQQSIDGLIERSKQLEKQIKDIKQRDDGPLILELGRIERDLAKLG